MFSSNTSQVSGAYEIQRSLRFNSADSAFLNRTPASATNRKTWTFNAWIKRGRITENFNSILEGYSGSNQATRTGIIFNNNFTLRFFTDAAATSDIITTQVFRDASAWYMITVAVDTTQATASNRVKIYVNGVQVTSFATANYPAQNLDTYVNDAVTHRLGGNQFFAEHLDGYMTEVNFIDGQALTPSSFGAFDAQTGVWGPTRYAGSYGTNGFYLNFSDNSNTTAATLGKDYSGNGNNWTPNNFSVSAGAGNDSLVDVPTNWGTDTGVGGSVRGNYSTINPLDVGSGVVVSNGNLDVSNAGADKAAKTTIGFSSGKWYAEATVATYGANYPTIGITATDFNVGTLVYVGQTATSYGYGGIGTKLNNGNAVGYAASWTAGDIIGIAVDLDAGTITFYKNGVSQGVAFTGISPGTYCFAFSMFGGTVFNCNFGQRPFAYTAPSGFKALSTQNLPTPTIGATTATQAGKFFNPVLFNKSSFPATIDGVGFQPDFTWWKERSRAQSNFLMDTLRGSNSFLISNSTAAADTQSNIWVSNADGWTTSTGGIALDQPYVAWNWKANGAGVTNTAGSITSTVSANTTSGFSVVTYTGNGSTGATIGHGLGAAPKMVIVKNRGAVTDWIVGHTSIGWTNFLKLNSTAASASFAVWNNTAPTSTVVTLGSDGSVNGSTALMVAYCFAEVPGYSRFGSYTGNGSADGAFVFCGFRPAYVMIKGTTAGATDTFWIIFDSKRNTYNLVDSYLAANNADAEGQNPTVASIDMLSNGFKVRSSNTSFGTNQPNNVYVFAAFAEAPQKFSLAR